MTIDELRDLAVKMRNSNVGVVQPDLRKVALYHAVIALCDFLDTSAFRILNNMARLDGGQSPRDRDVVRAVQDMLTADVIYAAEAPLPEPEDIR